MAETNSSGILKRGRVLKGQNGLYTVKSGDSLYQCRSQTKIRKEANLKLLAGDNVLFSENKDGSGFISAVSERRNSFIRPAAANVDMLLIAVSAAEPEPVPYNIDKLSVLAVNAGAEVYIVITKSDIVEPENLIDIYRRTPFMLSVTNIYDKNGLDEIKSRLRGKTTVLTGASGAGKSSLINKLYPYLQTEVGNLSEKIKRGRNTTRVTELFPLGEQTYIADTPGFTMLDPVLFCKTELKDLIFSFPDLAPFTDYCRYTDCTHTKEEECGVTGAVRSGTVSKSRHESYVKLYEEIKIIPQY